MRRWGLIFTLLVSVGLNAGILATLWVTRGKNPPPPRPPQEQGPPPFARPAEPPALPGELPREHPDAPPPPMAPPYGPPGSPPPRPQDHPDRPPLDDGPFGGESVETGPAPGTVGSVPTTPPPKLREFAERLGLSGEKRERFFSLQLKLIGTMREGRWRISRLRREVRVEMLSDRPDRTKIEASLAAIQSAQLALERETVRTVLDTREILDGDAERQYLAFITRMRLGAGEPRPNGPRTEGRMPGRPDGFDPGRERPADPENLDQPGVPGGRGGQLPPRLNRPNRPMGPQGGDFGRPGNRRRLDRKPTFDERMEPRRRFEEWRSRQSDAGEGTPLRSDPEGDGSPPPV